LILLPASVILAYAMDHWFSVFADMLRSGTMGPPGPEILLPSISAGSVFFLGYLTFYLGMLFATLAAMVVVGSELSDQPISWGEALATAFSVRFIRAIGLVLLEALAIGGVIMVAFVVLIAGISMHSTLTAVMGGLAIPVTLLAAAYLFVRWAFALPVIAWEDAGVFEAFRRSGYLVEGGWWRVFGILLLLTIVVQFGISILVTPINVFLFWGFYVRYFEWLGTLRAGEMDPTAIADMFSSMGVGIGISIFVSSVLSILVTPVFYIVMYFDLRARRGEFLPPSSGSDSVNVLAPLP
jgi:hypothetical protein